LSGRLADNGTVLLHAYRMIANSIDEGRTITPAAEWLVDKLLPRMVFRRMRGGAGWTRCTGSGGWMQRAGIESILGLHLEDDVLRLDPCIPKTWPRFEMTVRYRSAHHEILIENPDAVSATALSAPLSMGQRSGKAVWLEMLEDGVTHRALVRLG
jgi:cellobiose phosphorylase